MFVLTMLLTALPALAQTASFKGRNDRFALEITLRDRTGRNGFVARDTVIEGFDFVFTPRPRLYSARDFLFLKIFGKDGVRLGLEDVEIDLTSANGAGAMLGYFVRVTLSERGRARVGGYEHFGFRTGFFGTLEAPHHLILLQPDEDSDFDADIWHRAVGDGPYMKSLVECERVLDPSAPDREEGATFD